MDSSVKHHSVNSPVATNLSSHTHDLTSGAHTLGSSASTTQSEINKYRYDAEHTTNLQSRYLDNLEATELGISLLGQEINSEAISLENLEENAAYAKAHEVTHYVSHPWYLLGSANYHTTQHASEVSLYNKDVDKITQKSSTLANHEALLNSLLPQSVNETNTLNEILGITESSSGVVTVNFESAIALASLGPQGQETLNPRVTPNGGGTLERQTQSFLLVKAALATLQNTISIQERDLTMRKEAHEGDLSEKTAQTDFLANLNANQNSLNLWGQIQVELSNAIQFLQAAIRGEQNDLDDHDTLFDLLSWVPAVYCAHGQHNNRDKEEIAQNKQAIETLTTAAEMISSIIAQMQSNETFSYVKTEMSTILSEMEKLCKNAKNLGALLNGVLSLMIQALTVFNILDQDAEKQKVENKQKMGKSATQLSITTLKDLLHSQKIYALEEKVMNHSQVAQKILMWSLLALSLFSGSPFFLAFMIASTALQETGRMQKWQEELNNKYGNVDGDLIMAGIQLGIGAVGAATEIGLKIAANLVTLKIVDQVIEESSQITEDLAKKSLSSLKVFDKLPSSAQNEIENQVEKEINQAKNELSTKLAKEDSARISYVIADQSRKSAAKIALDEAKKEAQNASDNAFKLDENGSIRKEQLSIEYIGKQSASLTSKVIRDGFVKVSLPTYVSRVSANEGLRITTKQATRDAVEAVTQEIKGYIEKGELKTTLEGIDLDQLVTRATVKAIVKNTSMSEKDALSSVEKSALLGRGNAISSTVKRTLFLSAYAIGKSNVVADAIAALYKKEGKSEPSSIQILTEVIQALLEIIGMLGSMGGLSSEIEGGGKILSILTHGSMATQAGAQTANAVYALSLAKVLQEQAETVNSIQNQHSFQSLLKELLDQIQNGENKDEKAAMQRWIQNVKSLDKLATTVQSASNAGVQVIIEQTV